MRKLGRIVTVMGVAGALGGCMTTEAAYPVVGNPVNPRPAAGYRVTCDSAPSPTYFVSGDFIADCDPSWATTRTVVRARG